MMRVIGCVSGLLVCVTAASGCSAGSGTSESVSATSSGPAKLDQSSSFFPAAVDTYGLDLDKSDRDRLRELHALRQIDPCGFVNRKLLADNSYRDFTYTYSTVVAIDSGGRSPVAPLGGQGCLIAFPSSPVGLGIRLLPGELRWNDAQFSPDPTHPGMTTTSTWGCAYRVSLPLTQLAGAPGAMRDPNIEVFPADIADNSINLDDTSRCALAEQVAAGIATQIPERGIPVHSADSAMQVKALTADPCSVAPELRAVGFSWDEPRPDAQWPTTWRHPGVCHLRIDNAGGESRTASAVVKVGLAAWSSSVVDVPWGESPAHSEQDGVEYFTFSAYAPCLVIAEAGAAVEPVKIGSAAPELQAPTPVVAVRLRMPQGSNCADLAQQAARTAIGHAT